MKVKYTTKRISEMIKEEMNVNGHTRSDIANQFGCSCETVDVVLSGEDYLNVSYGLDELLKIDISIIDLYKAISKYLKMDYIELLSVEPEIEDKSPFSFPEEKYPNKKYEIFAEK